jgi:PAS domain S-box-containing protein
MVESAPPFFRDGRSRRLADSVADAILLIDRQGMVRYANPAAAELFARPLEELVGSSFGYPVGGGDESEVDISRPDGQTVFAEMRARQVEWDGEPFWVASLRDITARKLAVAALREGEATFRAFIDASPQAIVAFDEGGIIALANAQAERMFAYRGGQLAGRRVEVLAPSAPEGHPLRAGNLAPPSALEPWSGHPWTALRSDGVELPVEIALASVEVAGRRLTVAFLTDVTERLHLERQLLEAQKMHMVGQLAGGVAHDFNNLLTVVIGAAQLLARQPGASDSVRAPVEQILAAAERAAALTGQLLALGRRQMMQPVALHLNALITNLAPVLRSLGGEHTRLLFALEPELWPVFADPTQIEQVLINLTLNARDALPCDRGGEVVISTANVHLEPDAACLPAGVEAGQFVRLTVADNGHGMDAATLARIFEPFFTTKEPGKGKGLGLPTVYGIVRQHQGFVRVDSKPGGGTRVEIFLPMSRAGAPPEPEPAPAPTDNAEGSETILVMEDEPSLRRMICHALKRYGYHLLEAADAAEAERLCAHHPGEIHLLLTDVVMPGGDGPAVASELRRLRPGLRVLYMSGYAAEALGRHGLPPDDIHFLQKPFLVTELAHRVRQVLSSSP